MPARRILQLLLADADLEGEYLVRETLLDIEDSRLWSNWHGTELTVSGTLAETLEYGHTIRFDCILLNLGLPDSQVLLDTFTEVLRVVPSTPILVLSPAPDEHLASRLLREGAQDFLTRAQLEPERLARSVLSAIERQRRWNSIQSLALLDPITRLYNRQGFEVLFEHEVALAASTGMSGQVLFIEAEGLNGEDKDLFLSYAGDALRSVFGPASIKARLDHSRLCVLEIGSGGMRIYDQLESFTGYITHLCGNAQKLRIRTACMPIQPEEQPTAASFLEMAETRLTAKRAMLAG